MSVQTPPTLLTLARQALLRDEALAISNVENLPVELFPALFKEAFTGRHTKITTAIVAAWPFPCLPVGALMKTPDLETFQAVLAGVDMGLKRRFQPRRGKLQVLNLRKEHHNFWSIWAGAEDGDCSAESLDEAKQVAKGSHRHAQRRRLKVVADLWLRFHLNEEQECLLQWARERKGFLQLCCRKMKIWCLPVHGIIEILSVFQAEHVEELELNMVSWNVLKLAQLAPCLGQMRNLRRLSLATAYRNSIKFGNRTRDSKGEGVYKFVSQFSRFNCLQHLSMRGMCFLRGHTYQLLRCLMIPLKTLSITDHQISQSDLDGLSQCQKLFQLRHLDMRGVVLLDLDVVPFGVFLKKVAGTLQSLDLKGCRMTDPQLTALIPALGQCYQLTKVSFCDNDFSVPILIDLFQHSANLSKMNEERYPAPLECYDELGNVSIDGFALFCTVLMDTLWATRQPKSISFAAYICKTCSQRCVYDLEFRLCSCFQ